MDWQHPTHRKPQTVALVSLGPSRESYVAQALARDPDPLIVDCEEIWTVNRGALPVRRAEAVSQERMSAITAGMPLPPGMKLPF